MLKDLSSYLYPELDSINLCCAVKCNLSSSVIQRALLGQVITFRQPVHQQNCFYAECEVTVKISESCTYAFMGFFWVDELVTVGDSPAEEGVFGALVAEDTQIVVTPTQRQLQHATSIFKHGEDILTMLSDDVSHALLGCMQRCLAASSSGCIGTLLLIGQSGSGCVSSACAAADRIGAYKTIISPGTLYAEFAACAGVGGLTRAWGRHIVRQAVLRALAVRQPCVLILEDLHFLIPGKGVRRARAGGRQRTEAEEGMAEGLCAILTSLLELNRLRTKGMHAGQAGLRVLVVGCASEEGLVDAPVRDCFEECLHFPLPDAHQRRDVLHRAWASLSVVMEGQFSGSTASPPHSALETLADNLAGTPLVPLLLQAKELVAALFEQNKNSSSESSVGVLRVFDRRVAGLPQVKRALVETVLWPRRYAALYRSFAAAAAAGSSSQRRGGHLGLPAGVLLFGPPGTGKTLLPRALAEELGCALINVRLSDVVRGEIGTSEKRVRELFQSALRGAPSVVFIDEFQALFTAQEEGGGASTLSSTLAGCFDDLNRWNRHAGAESMVTVIAATNEPWAIGTAFLRPGRLEKCVFVGPLDLAGRAECVTMLVDGCAADLAEDVARRTEGFTGADMVLLCARARQQHLSQLGRENGTKDEGVAAVALTVEDFVAVRRATPASTHRDDIAEFLDWQAMHPYLNTDS